MCNECNVCFVDAIAMNQVDVVNFMCEHQVLKRRITCVKCGNVDVTLHSEELTFRCQKRISIRKQKKTPCNLCLSGKIGSFFEMTKLPLIVYWRLIAFILHLAPPRQDFIRANLKISSRTIVDWYSYVREVFIFDMANSSEKIGGQNKVVEIDEAKFGRSKYNRGRYIEGQWVFGGVERGSNKSFYVPVEKRDASTLLEVLKEYVQPHTIIISDCWKAYKDLNEEGFEHFTVNHSINFVDPTTGAHTNNIERSWREVRATIPRYGRKKDHFAGYLAEFYFKRRYDLNSRFHHFYRAAAALYPPKY